MENKIVPHSKNKLNLNKEESLALYTEFDFSNGLLKKPIKEFSNTLSVIFPGDKYSLFRNQVVDLFGIDQNLSNKIDENSTINKIFLLEVKILKKHIIELMEDANPEQENLLADFLALVNKNLDKVNNILETNTHLPVTGITQNGSSLVKYSQNQNPFELMNLSSTKNFITSKWLESVDKIFESDDIEKSINEFVLVIFKDNGFKLTVEDKINISQIIKSMCVNLEIISKAKIKLEAYNKKYTDLGLAQSIKSIGSIKKTSVLLLTKTFLDKYLDQLIDVVEYKISSIEKILDGGNVYKSGIKYLKYKIEYLVNKKI
jgi:hypothetical protein